MTVDVVAYKEMADILDELPELLYNERIRRGLSLRQAQVEIGKRYNVIWKWENRAGGMTADNASCVLRWLSESLKENP